MSAAQHTPAPWRVGVGGPNGCPTVGTERGLLICMLGHSVHIPKQADTARANARLIAAAPDMLEALRAMDAASTMQTVWDALIIGRDAIAKAEGRS